MTAAAPDAPHLRFDTRTLLPTDTLLLVFYLLGSLLLLSVGVALAPQPALRLWLAWGVAVLPAGGYLLFAALLERRIRYELTADGLWVRMAPAYRYSIVQPRDTLYHWNDIADATEDANLLLGRYGYLEIGIRNPDEVLQIVAARRSEAEAFRQFALAFAAEVELLNRDETPRAVSVALIRHRPSLFHRPWAKLASVVLALGVLSGLTLGLLTDGGAPFWQHVYLYLLLVPLALYGLRRSFGWSRRSLFRTR